MSSLFTFSPPSPLLSSRADFEYAGGKLIPEHGLLALAGGLAFVINLILVIMVGKARKKYKVSPPVMTETRKDAKGELRELPLAYLQAQRAHLNNVENLPLFYGLLILGGIGFPAYVGLCGLGYQLFRFIGGVCYSLFGAKGRFAGGLFHVFELAMVYYTFKTAYVLLA
jgi:glutathione S-transferase